MSFWRAVWGFGASFVRFVSDIERTDVLFTDKWTRPAHRIDSGKVEDSKRENIEGRSVGGPDPDVLWA